MPYHNSVSIYTPIATPMLHITPLRRFAAMCFFRALVKQLLGMFSMRTVGGIVSPLVVVDRGQGVIKWSSILGEFRGDQLPDLGFCECRNFFWKTKHKRTKNR